MRNYSLLDRTSQQMHYKPYVGGIFRTAVVNQHSQQCVGSESLIQHAV